MARDTLALVSFVIGALAILGAATSGGIAGNPYATLTGVAMTAPYLYLQYTRGKREAATASADA